MIVVTLNGLKNSAVCAKINTLLIIMPHMKKCYFQIFLVDKYFFCTFAIPKSKRK